MGVPVWSVHHVTHAMTSSQATKEILQELHNIADQLFQRQMELIFNRNDTSGNLTELKLLFINFNFGEIKLLTEIISLIINSRRNKFVYFLVHFQVQYVLKLSIQFIWPIKS